MRLTTNFTREELACSHCGQMRFTIAAVQHLQALRDGFGRPIRVNSGYRCPEHNDAVSKTGLDGPHTIIARDNITVDIAISGVAAFRLLRIVAEPERGWTGIGIRQSGPYPERFIHLDRLPIDGNTPRPRLWSY